MEKRENAAPSARSEKSAAPATWGEDWSKPPQKMSAAVPLIWMAVAFVGCVVWGYFFT